MTKWLSTINRKTVFTFVFLIFTVFSFTAIAENLCTTVNSAILIAQDDKETYLGKISSPFDGESIFNEYGTYGSQYSSNSIWNQYTTFGSAYSSYSPFSKYSSSPPIIIKNKKIIGYLSANKSFSNSVSPDLLKALCKDEL